MIWTTYCVGVWDLDREALSVASRGFLLHSDFFFLAPAEQGLKKKKKNQNTNKIKKPLEATDRASRSRCGLDRGALSVAEGLTVKI